MLYIIAFIFGSIWGSFSNVCIYRIPKNIGIIKDRSFCPNCQKMIKWYDNIPLLSFIILKAQCRNCSAGINWNYFLVELISGLNFVLAFYFFGDLLNDYTNLELISTISTMETFQKIYRPEIYNANAVAGRRYRPNLKNPDHSLTQIVYDREERSQLAVAQGKFAEEHFIKPYQRVLEQWSQNYAL